MSRDKAEAEGLRAEISADPRRPRNKRANILSCSSTNMHCKARLPAGLCVQTGIHTLKGEAECLPKPWHPEEGRASTGAEMGSTSEPTGHAPCWSIPNPEFLLRTHFDLTHGSLLVN